MSGIDNLKAAGLYTSSTSMSAGKSSVAATSESAKTLGSVTEISANFDKNSELFTWCQTCFTGLDLDLDFFFFLC